MSTHDPGADESGAVPVTAPPTGLFAQLTEEQILATPALLAGDATDLIAALRAGADRRGLEVAVVEDGATSIPVGPHTARLGVLAIRRRGSTSPLARAFELAARLDPLLAPSSVVIAVTVKGVTELAPDKLERLLSREILHQVESAITPATRRRPWRQFRLRAGLAALDAAGVRVLRIRGRRA
ncbi:hypothetical protein [Curtobacterium sp. RRHDQ10]|uniref:hypothetical protein n=1 Tax=Curtobacterium phyllosphaerae TaxID=3413379 RepID=UPI003BF2E2B3